MANEPKSSKYLAGQQVEKTTAGGSRVISYQLTSEARRGLTIELPTSQRPRETDTKGK